MQIDGHENIPFSLFISSMRRRKILQAMSSDDDGLKKDGEKILNNYKKQLAERLAREHAENNGYDFKSQMTSRSKKSLKSKMAGTNYSSKSKGESDAIKLVSQKLQEISSF